MLTFSVIDNSRAFRLGLTEGVRFDGSAFGSFGFRAIPLAEPGIDPAAVARVDFVLTTGGESYEFSAAGAPFEFFGTDDTALGDLAAGDYSLTATPFDATGTALEATALDFALGTPLPDEGFQGFRIQAEELEDGDVDGIAGADVAADGNFARVGGPTTPIVRRVGDPNLTLADVTHAELADNDAYVDMGATNGEFIEFVFNVPAAGAYDVDFGYALGGAGTNRSMLLTVNGVSFDTLFDFRSTNPVNTNFGTYAEAQTRLTLVEGQNVVRLAINGASAPNFDYLDVRPADPNRIVIQAEDLVAPVPVNQDGTVNRPITQAFVTGRNAFTGTSGETFRVGAEGASYLDYAGPNAATLDFPVTVPVAGTYTIAVTYVNGGGAARPLTLSDAGAPTSPLATFNFAATPAATGRTPALSGWENWSVETVTVTLEAGTTTLRLAGANGPNIDKLVFQLVEAAPTAPTALALDHLAVVENDAGGVIGNLAVTDGTGAPLTFAVDDARFVVEAGQLRLADGVALDFETETSVAIEVTASNVAGSTTQTFVIGVGNDAADDPAPLSLEVSVVAVAENAAGAIVADIAIDGPDAPYDADAVTLAGADAALFRVIEIGDVLKLALAESVTLDFEAGARPGVTVEFAGLTSDVTVVVSNVNEAPADIALAGATVAEDAPAGTAVGQLAAVDPENDAIFFTVDDARFEVTPDGVLVVADAAALAPGVVSVEVTASDGAASSSETFDLTITAAEPAGPRIVAFNALTTYNATQDAPFAAGPATPVVTDGGETVTLGNNFWKRAALGEPYPATQDTRLTVEIALSAISPEIVGIGFDTDNDPFNGNGLLFQLAGTQGNAAFVDLRGTGEDAGDGKLRFVLDLGPLAGQSLTSVVLVNDDDVAGNGIGAATFSNVSISEVDPGNAAPEAVGGGIADLTLDEGTQLEISLPFVDADGDDLSYAFSIDGDDPASVAALTAAFEAQAASGEAEIAFALPASVLPGAYVVTVVASDESASATDAFTLTVLNVNAAPTVEDAALEPVFGEVGSAIDSIAIADFAGLFSDPDLDALTFTVEGLPAGLTFDAEEGVIFGVPTAASAAPFILRATDPSGLSVTLEIPLVISGPVLGEPIVIEAEAFTGLSGATGFYATGNANASGDALIRMNANQNGAIETALAPFGVTEGFYRVSITVYDETDGDARFTLRIGDLVLADDVAIGSAGVFDTPGAPRGAGGQIGNVKTITFDVPAFVDADTRLTLTGRSDQENLRIDKVTLLPVEAPVDAAPQISGLPASVTIDENGSAVATISVSDPEGGEVEVTLAGADAALFAYDAETGVLGFVEPADAEDAADADGDGVYEVTVVASDGVNVTSAAVAVTVADVNEALSLSPGALALAENATAAGVIAVLDEDGGTAALVAPVFAIVGGADAALFAIDPATGALSFLVAPDFEAPADADGDNVYDLDVQVSDGALVATRPVAVTVTNVAVEPVAPIVIQAEDQTRVAVTDLGTPVGAAVTRVVNAANPDAFGSFWTGAAGDAYLDFGTDAGDTAVFTVEAPVAGTYTATIRYANGSTDANRPLKLTVGDDAGVVVAFPATPGGATPWANWTDLTVTLTLAAGANSVALSLPTAAEGGLPNGPNIDQISFALLEAIEDDTADAGAPLALTPVEASVEAGAALEAVVFRLTGVDADVVGFELSVNAGETFAPATVVADGPGAFLVTIDLSGYEGADAGLAEIRVTDASGNVATVQGEVPITTGEPEPFVLEIQAETFTVIDPTAAVNDRTQARVPGNVEPTPPATTPGNLNNDGLWDNFTGAGYMDMGLDIGDAVEFTVDAPAAGQYVLDFRYANGGGGANPPRPMSLSVNGDVVATPQFPGTGANGWYVWADEIQTVTLQAGVNTIRLTNTIATGPNLDKVTITSVGAPVDDTADADGNLTLTVVDLDDADAAVFAVTGLDADIVTIEIAVNGGARQAVTPAANGQFTLDLGGLAPGAAAVAVFVTDAAGNEATDVTTATIGQDLEPFVLEIQGEAFGVIDTNGVTGLDLTQARVPGNTETITAERPTGLWAGFTGAGYMDMGQQAGDAATFAIDAPADGVYTLTFRYGNGGTTNRPMTFTVDGGQAQTIAFVPGAAWTDWREVSVEVQLTAGQHAFQLANVGGTGPNIDRVTITAEVPADPDVSEPGPRDVIRINFQDGAAPDAAGYLVDNFQGFGDRGNGLTYGWVTEASAIDANGATNTPINGAAYPAVAINERSGGVFDTYDPRLTGYAHFDLAGSYPAGAGSRVAWEIDLADGWYEVTVAVGDTGGPDDSNNRLFIEGEISSSFTPTSLYKTELVTKVVQVEDGRLTLSAQGGTITEIQYLEIRELPDLTPGDGAEAPADYAFFTDPRAVAQDGSEIIQIDLDPAAGFASGVDPASDIFLGIGAVDGRGGVLLASLADGSIRLFETLTGAEVAFTAQTTAGFDSVTISPTGLLKPNTSYTLVVDGARDRGTNDEDAGTTREFQKFSTTFLTGDTREVEAREVAFEDTVIINGAADDASLFTSIELSPDGQYLYVATLAGEINRWELNADGSVDKASLETFTPGGDFNVAGGRRGIVGFVFDPTDPNTIWITDNYPVPLSGVSNSVPDFSGRISKVTLGAGGDLESATIEPYITGLPRSSGDHVTNSLEFRANPDYDAAANPDAPEFLLYLIQGSNSAMGQPDSNWGFRPERLLNAAVMEIDPTRDAPPGGFDVSTEPLPADGLNRRFADADNNLKNGGIAITSGEFNGDYLHFDANGVATVRDGAAADSALVEAYYDPFAADAVLKIFATGQRNAYDLVWHSNGYLYVPTNGSAAGGNVPDNPNTPQNEGFNGVGLQSDYLFRVEEGGYYGHPNPLRGEFILNGGNPTAGTDPNQVNSYPVGTAPDPDYDVQSAYNLGTNRSPNGATEYTSNVFGSSLQGAVLFTEYSGGNDVRAVLLDANGYVTQDFVLRDLQGNVITYDDPLDIIQNPVTGQLYLMTLNRANGQSQIIRLDPAPGGVIGDNTADAGDDLGLVVVDASDAGAVLFQVVGLDNDIETITVSFGGAPQTVALNGQNRFTADLSGQTGAVTATLTVGDDDGNTATAGASFTPGAPTTVTVIDATAFTNLNPAATIIRNIDQPTTHEVDGIYDLDSDGMNDGYDGLAYADFGGGAGNKVSFTYVAAAAGTYDLVFRMANGSPDPRPIAISSGGETVTIANTNTGSFLTWVDFPVTLTLEAGVNTIVVAQTAANGGPNLDSVRVTLDELAGVPNDGVETVGGVVFVRYEAENAALAGPAIVEEDRNQSGDFVDYVGPGNETITWTVSVAADGTYGVDVLYALATSKAARPMTVTVNGVAQGTLPFVGQSDTAETTWFPQSAQLTLNAGINTIALTAPAGVGPNVDYLRVSAAPVDVFEPDYAEVGDGLRIELEQTADNSTRTVDPRTVDFFLTVAADGLYALDVAANGGAPAGGALTFFLNGVQIDQTGFPGTGEAGEQTVYVELEAGVDYQLRVVSAQPGAAAIDYLDVNPAPGDVTADIEIDSLDPAYLENRLHFSWLDNDSASNPDRAFKENATVVLSNSGTTPLTVLDFDLSGPFDLADPAILDGLTLAAGQSIQVEVLFDRTAYVSGVNTANGVFTGALVIRTNDADTPVATVDLAGFWQARDEGGWEPSVNEVWQMFGFGTRVAGVPNQDSVAGSPLNNFDIYEAVNELEILSPYWRLADGVTEARITQIAAFHGTGGATMGIHNPGNKNQQVIFTNHAGDNNQSILPVLSNGNFATATFTNATIPDAWVGAEVFGIEMADFSTDPRLNAPGEGAVPPGTQRGHFTRIFQALDADGEVIPNVYLGIQDYTGINYDYNDNMFVIEGVTPVGFGGALTIGGLDASAADDRLVFTNIDNPNNAGGVGGQQFRNEATITLTNTGFAPVAITGLALAGEDAAAFEIVGAPTSLAAGASATVTIRFIGTDPADDSAATLYTGALTVTSNAFGAETQVVQLAGLAQLQSEGGEEPTVAEIVEAFGYSTDVGGQIGNNAPNPLANGGLVAPYGPDEVLMPYLERLDGSRPIEVIQLAAFLNQTNVARLGFHGLASAETTALFAQDDQQGQTVSPDGHVPGAGNTGGVARATINQDAPFGLYISVDGRPTYASWSDPEANRIDPEFGDIVGPNQGHLIRFFQARDAAGNAIEGTYIGIQDYPGAGNYDYNDHMFIIKNVRPHQLAAAEDADGDDVNDALQRDVDGDGVVDFFDPDNTPAPIQTPFGGTAPDVGAAALTVLARQYDDGGQGVAYNDQAGLQGGTTGGRPGSAVEVTTGGAVGWIANGEWLEYTVDVETAGAYALNLLTSTDGPGRSVAVSVEQNGAVYATGSVAVANTGSYTNFQSGATVALNLEAGLQTVRLTFLGGSMDIQSFTLAPPPAVQTPFGGTAPSFTGGSLTVLANAFDNGGQGVAYNDDAGLDGGNTAFRPGRDVEFVGAQNDIGHVSPGEWLEYTINVPTAGVYDLNLVAKTPVSGATVTVSLAGGATLGVVSLADGHAGGANFANAAFATSAAVPVTLAAGPQTLRLTFDGPLASNGYVLDLRSFTLEAANRPPVAATIAAQQTTEDQGFTLNVGAAFTDADGDALTFAATGLPAGLAINAAGVISGAPTTPGAYNVTVTASDGAATASAGFALVVAAAAPIQTPFGGTAPEVDGAALTVLARQYDDGGQGVAYNDQAGLQGGTTGGRPGSAVEVTAGGAVGWIANGEWLEYTVDVETAGAHTLNLLTATNAGGRSVGVSVEQNGAVYATASVAVANTGSYTNFQPGANVTLNLEAGLQTVRLTFLGGSMDIQSFTLTPPPSQTPFGGTAPSFTGGALTVLANAFDNGGQGVAYNDDAGLDGGNTAFRPGRDVEMVGGQNDIGFVSPGEWLEYTINVPTAGVYDLDLVAKTPVSGATVTVSLAGGATLGVVSLADGHAGGANFANAAFATSAAVPVTLAAGPQTLRLTFDGPPASNGYVLDLRSFTLEAAGPSFAALALRSPDETAPDPEDAAADASAATTPDASVVAPAIEAIGQSGSVRFTQSGPGCWFSVTFDAPIENPAVVMGPLTRNGADPAVMAVRNVTSQGFQFQLDEWDYLDGRHPAETVSWMAVKSGTHVLENGLVVAAGVGTAGSKPVAIDFETAFDAAPVVFAQAHGAPKKGAATDRISDVGRDGFSVRLQEEDAADGYVPPRALSWIAMSKGGAVEDGVLVGSAGATHKATAVDFGGAFDAPLAFVADMQTVNCGATASTRLHDRADAGAKLFVEQEASESANLRHAAEDVGYVALEEGLIFGFDQSLV